MIREGWYLTGDLAYQDKRGLFLHCRPARRLLQKPRHIHLADGNQKTPCKNIPRSSKPPSFPSPMLTSAIRFTPSYVLADGYTPSAEFGQSIRESLRFQIAPYRIPHQIEFSESLPKSAIGKILRTGLSAS